MLAAILVVCGACITTCCISSDGTLRQLHEKYGLVYSYE